MRTLIAARDWLTVVRSPAYAPDLNPTEGVWARMKRGITNIVIPDHTNVGLSTSVAG